MDEPTRRAWSKPELVVLVRGGAEEAVLTTCKHPTGVQIPGNPSSGDYWCVNGGTCNPCSARADS